MNRQSILEQLRALGAVAAHANNRWVTSVRGKPVRVTLVHPLFLDRPRLRVGDKVAIVDTEEGVAFLCRATAVEYSELSRSPRLDLTVIKTLELA